VTPPGISIGIVSPDGRDGMIQHAKQFAEAGIPFIFDPGQGMPMFGGDDLVRFVEQATWVTLNDYEAQLMCERTGLTWSSLASRVKAWW
jgi:adenosine kinase